MEAYTSCLFHQHVCCCNRMRGAQGKIPLVDLYFLYLSIISISKWNLALNILCIRSSFARAIDIDGEHPKWRAPNWQGFARLGGHRCAHYRIIQAKNAWKTNYRRIVTKWRNSAPKRRHYTIANTGDTCRTKRLVTSRRPIHITY